MIRRSECLPGLRLWLPLNNPGTFTTFIDTATASDGGNLHRNVIFRGDTAPNLPFSRLDSSNPEDLWDWMDGLRDQGMDSLAIPHNSNGSNGNMFMLTDNMAGRLMMPMPVNVCAMNHWWRSLRSRVPPIPILPCRPMTNGRTLR